VTRGTSPPPSSLPSQSRRACGSACSLKTGAICSYSSNVIKTRPSCADCTAARTNRQPRFRATGDLVHRRRQDQRDRASSGDDLEKAHAKAMPLSCPSCHRAISFPVLLESKRTHARPNWLGVEKDAVRVMLNEWKSRGQARASSGETLSHAISFVSPSACHADIHALKSVSEWTRFADSSIPIPRSPRMKRRARLEQKSGQ